MAITSFYPSKPLGCYGDGGAIFTANKELAQKARMLANHGSEERYLHKVAGMNSRLDALQAAVLRVKLAHLNAELKARKAIAERYNAFFANIKGLTPQQIADGNTSTYAQYTLLVDNRKDFVATLDQAGIPHCIHYPMPLHRQPCFAELSARYAENAADMASQKAVSLPMCAFTPIDEIIERLKKVF
jgi:Predicted pyridoxal phosphate-dependent enzyme apparently involved in regulation of cell wall biogenesis